MYLLKPSNISQCTSTVLHLVRLHAQVSPATVVARLGHLIGLVVPVYKRWGRIDLFSNSATAGGDMPRSAGCCWSFFRLAKQNTNKLASGQLNPCRTMKTWTAPQCCTLHIYALLLVQIRCSLPLALTRLLFSLWLSSTNLCFLSSGSKNVAGIIDHMQNA